MYPASKEFREKIYSGSKLFARAEITLADNADTTLKISGNKVIYNHTNTVKTGDTNNVLLWAALFVVSCAGMAGITVVAKKRK